MPIAVNSALGLIVLLLLCLLLDVELGALPLYPLPACCLVCYLLA